MVCKKTHGLILITTTSQQRHTNATNQMDLKCKSQSKRKQKLVSLEMLPGSTAKEPTIYFPNVKFGSSTMNKEQLESLLKDHLHLQTLERKNTLGLGYVRDFTRDELLQYEPYRLAAVAWFVSVLPGDMMISCSCICTLIPSVSLMDRYITILVSSGRSLLDVLAEIEVIRAASLALSIKMHGVNTAFTSSEIASMNTWAPRAHAIRGLSPDIEKMTTKTNDSHTPVCNAVTKAPGDGKAIHKAIKNILSELKGGVFPSNAENTISVMCHYLVLDYFSRVPESVIQPHVAVEKVDTKAFELFTRSALNVQCLTVPKWKCMAVCSLLAMRHVCITTKNEEVILKQTFTDVFQKIYPDGLSEQDVSKLMSLLTAECVVCNNTFTVEYMQQYLLQLSAVSCLCCRDEFLKN